MQLDSAHRSRLWTRPQCKWMDLVHQSCKIFPKQQAGRERWSCTLAPKIPAASLRKIRELYVPPDTACVAIHPQWHKPPHWTVYQRQGVELVKVKVPRGKSTADITEVVLVHIWLLLNSETASDHFEERKKKKKIVQSASRLGLHSAPLSETSYSFSFSDYRINLIPFLWCQCINIWSYAEKNLSLWSYASLH